MPLHTRPPLCNLTGTLICATPPPSSRVRLNVGDKVEYYWNDEWEWCTAEVVEKVGPVAGEFIFGLKFDIDGEVHKCAFGGEDKVRWRPVL